MFILKSALRNNTPNIQNKRNIIIDLNKFNKLQNQAFDNKTNTESNYMPSKLSHYQQSKMSHYQQANHSSLNTNNNNNNNIPDNDQFISFNRIMRIINDYQDEDRVEDNKQLFDFQMKDLLNQLDQSDNENQTMFRLPVLLPDNTIIKSKDKYVVDLMKEKHMGYNSVKDFEQEAHTKMLQMRDEVKLVVKEPVLTNDQRFFQKAFGNMSFGCLRAIDKAYIDRGLVDARHHRKKKIQKLKEQNQYSMKRVEYYKEDKIKESLAAINERNEMKSRNEQKWMQESETLRELVQEERLKRDALHRNRRKDVELAVEFSKQHLSVSKALQKHEHLTQKDLKSKENLDLITKLKVNKENQRELVRKYMQQRNVLRLIQSNNDRTLIENRLREDEEEEQRNAKIRVEYLRYLEYNRRARLIMKKKKTENPTKILNVGEQAPSSANPNEVFN